MGQFQRFRERVGKISRIGVAFGFTSYGKPEKLVHHGLSFIEIGWHVPLPDLDEVMSVTRLFPAAARTAWMSQRLTVTGQ